MCHVSEVDDLLFKYPETKELTDAEVIAALELIEQFGGAL